MIGGFEFAVGPVGGVGFVMKAAVGERTTETLVEEQKEERELVLQSEGAALNSKLAFRPLCFTCLGAHCHAVRVRREQQ